MRPLHHVGVLPCYRVKTGFPVREEIGSVLGQRVFAPAPELAPAHDTEGNRLILTVCPAADILRFLEKVPFHVDYVIYEFCLFRGFRCISHVFSPEFLIDVPKGMHYLWKI